MSEEVEIKREEKTLPDGTKYVHNVLTRIPTQALLKEIEDMRKIITEVLERLEALEKKLAIA